MSINRIEQELLDTVSIDEMMSNLKVLAQKPRLSGSSNELDAFHYIQSKVTQYGVQSTLYPFRAILSYPVKASVEVATENNRVLTAKTRSYSPCTPPGGVEGEIIYIPGGKNMFVDTETKKLLEKADLRGKIVLTEGGGRQNMIFAQQKGAVGYIHMWPSPDPLVHDSTVSPIWGPPIPEKLGTIPSIPVVSITNMDGMALLEASKTGKVVVRLHTTTDTGWHDQRVLECNIPGRTSEFVMVGAHVDTWYYGVTDNLTGVSIAMELLRVFSKMVGQLDKGLRVCFWCGHSPGRFTGSTWYSDQKWFDLRRNCVTYLNIDMPGTAGATAYPAIDAAAETASIGQEAICDLTGQHPAWKRPPRAADMSFWGIGLPVLLAIGPSTQPPETRNPTGSPWFWHTEEDLMDKVGPDVLLTDARIFALCAARIVFPKKLPLSAISAAEELTQILKGFIEQSQGSFDLSPVAEALAELTATVTEFSAAMGCATEDDTIDSLNRGLSQALKNLCTINYTSIGEFEHDPAVPATPLALLSDVIGLSATAPDYAGFVRTKLVRNRNKVVWHIREAIRLLKAAM